MPSQSSTAQSIIQRKKSQQCCYLVEMVHHVLQKRGVVLTERKGFLVSQKIFSVNHNLQWPNLSQKKAKETSFFSDERARNSDSMACLIDLVFHFFFISNTFRCQSKCLMVSNFSESIWLTFDFNPDLFIFNVNDLVQQLKKITRLSFSGLELVLVSRGKKFWTKFLPKSQPFPIIKEHKTWGRSSC